MKNTPEKPTTIQLDTDKLFGRHWIGETQVGQVAASMPTTKPDTTKIGNTKPDMTATKIGQQKPAADIGKSQPKVVLRASKFSIGKPTLL